MVIWKICLPSLLYFTNDWPACSLDTILKLETEMMTVTKFGCNWLGDFISVQDPT